MAVRPIDSNIAKKRLQAWIDESEIQGFKDTARNLRSCMSLLDAVPTLTPPNEPLSIEQLREMDGEPVYIVFSPDSDGVKLQFWALVAVDEWDDVYLANKEGWAFNYEKFLEDVEGIYRRPPEA